MHKLEYSFQENNFYIRFSTKTNTLDNAFKGTIRDARFYQVRNIIIKIYLLFKNALYST